MKFRQKRVLYSGTARITRIHRKPKTENRKLKNGGERGIRTLGKSFGPTRDFQSRPFSLSGISPRYYCFECSVSSFEICTIFSRNAKLKTRNLNWRRGWDSNPREGDKPPSRFRVDPVTASSVPLRLGFRFWVLGFRFLASSIYSRCLPVNRLISIIFSSSSAG
jgi:hypothetical protein